MALCVPRAKSPNDFLDRRSVKPTPSMNPSIRSVLLRLCFGVGGIWALAGAMKLAFGFAVHFPLLPRFGLEEVDVVTSLVVAVTLFAGGALLRRYDARRERSADAAAHERAV